MALNGVMVVTLQLPVTHWVERRSRGLVLAAGSLLVAVGMGLTGLATGLVALAATVAVWTLGEVLLASSGQVVVAALAPEAIRARYFGAFSLSMNAAMVIAPGVGGYVLAHFGGGTLWAGSAVLGLLSALGMLLVRQGLDQGRAA
jgi:MFS family permease